MKGLSYDDKSNAFSSWSLEYSVIKEVIKEVNNTENESQNTLFPKFKPLVLSSFDILRDKKKRPNLTSIYNHILKTQASNAEIVLIASVVSNLTAKNLINIKDIWNRFWFFPLEKCNPFWRHYVLRHHQ